MDDPLEDPRLTETGRRYAHGPYEGRVKRKTKQIMAQVQRCDESTDDEGFCPCARTIMLELQRAYDEPAPPLGEGADPTYEPVGYRYRHNERQRWYFAPEKESEDMAVLAEKGWQVERLYRRESDTEVEGE